MQTRVGDAVQTVCGGLGAAGTVADDGSDVGDLFGRCRELVQTGNAVNASDGATAFDLGLNAAQLNDALLEVAHEESAAQGTSVTEVGTPAAGNVAVRIAELQGGATGFNVAALKMNVSGYSVPVASVMPREAGAASGQEAMEFSRLGGFVNGSFGFGEFDGSDEEAGFDFDTYGITAGLDYLFSDKFFAGIALTYSTENDDFDFAAGEQDIDSYTRGDLRLLFH